jgi:hypothetical protein
MLGIDCKKFGQSPPPKLMRNIVAARITKSVRILHEIYQLEGLIEEQGTEL